MTWAGKVKKAVRDLNTVFLSLIQIVSLFHWFKVLSYDAPSRLIFFLRLRLPVLREIPLLPARQPFRATSVGCKWSDDLILAHSFEIVPQRQFELQPESLQFTDLQYIAIFD